MMSRAIVLSGLFSLLALAAGCSSKSSAGSPCASLESCCNASAFPDVEMSACKQEVSTNVGAACGDALTAYQSAGYCTPGASGSSGTKAASCTSLLACCSSATFPSTETASCDDAVVTNVDSECATALSAFSSAGYCGSSGGSGPGSTGGTLTGGCAGLQTCCGSLSSGLAQGCSTVVTTGDDTACSEALASYEAANQC